jgi:hypothetical protein
MKARLETKCDRRGVTETESRELKEAEEPKRALRMVE